MLLVAGEGQGRGPNLLPRAQLPTANFRKLGIGSNFQLPTSGSRILTSNFQLPEVGSWKWKVGNGALVSLRGPQTKTSIRTVPRARLRLRNRKWGTSDLPSRRPGGGTFAASLPPLTPASREHPTLSDTLGGEIPILGCALIRCVFWLRATMRANCDTREL